MHLGAALIALGRWQDAIAEYQSAIQVASGVHIYSQWKDVAVRTIQAHAYANLAAIYDELGDYPKMRDSYREALKVDPQQGPEMIERLTSYAESEPSGKNYLQLAVLLQECGQLSEARDAYQQALKLDPSLDEAKQALHAMGPDHK
jgi:tetratricopeptide (TPR) repeat protein